MTAWWLSLVLMATGLDPVVPIPVAVFAPADITDSMVDRICAEAAVIWEPAGIAFEWHRIGSRDEAGDWPLDVTIDDASVAAGSLGWVTFTADGPNHSVHLSRACAEDMLRRSRGWTNIAIARHDTLVGRALGRALAHELGHYFLRTKVHTPRGLMRAAWSADESFGVSREGFQLTAEELAALR
jgi:hypothetical protein